MDKRITLLGLAFCFSFYLCAQNNNMRQINEIKKQVNEYLYGESAAQTWEEALDNAKYLLDVEIEMWLKTHNVEIADGLIVEAHKHIYYLESMRGDRFFAFVYIRKADILPYAKIIEPSPILKKEVQKSMNDEKTSICPNAVSQYQPSEFAKEMMSITDANDIGTFILNLKSYGKIVRYGQYKELPSDIDCYLFVYNREKTIPAYLYKLGNYYINLKTGKQDQVTNYDGCGAWWFQLK